MISKGDVLTLEINDLNNLGCGVGRAEDGRVVFVQGAVDGDTVKCKVIKVSSKYYVARLEGIVKESQYRMSEQFCNVPESCGGCVYRHLTYERELYLKKEYVTHCFRKAGLSDVEIEDVRSTGQIKGYRNKAEYPLSASKNGIYGGFYANKTHNTVKADNCALQPDIFGDILRDFCDFMTKKGATVYDEKTGHGLLRHLYLREGKGRGELMVCPVINGETLPDESELVRFLVGKYPRISSFLVNTNTKNTNVVLGDKYRTLYGKAYLTDTLCSRKFNIAPSSFYQVNHDAAELLYSIAAEKTQLNGNGILLDLYCGAGTIGLSMSEKASEIVGIEIVPSAVICAKENAKLNGIENASFYCGDAADAEGLRTPVERERGKLSPDTVILDPPRKGCDAQLLHFLAERGVPRIVYVSCGPDTLARDCAILRELGYEIGSVTPVDLFPRTGHVESVVCLMRKESNI